MNITVKPNMYLMLAVDNGDTWLYLIDNDTAYVVDYDLDDDMIEDYKASLESGMIITGFDDEISVYPRDILNQYHILHRIS